MPVQIGDVAVTGRMYEIDVLGYNGEKAPLRLFDLESIDDSIITEGIRFDERLCRQKLNVILISR
ncbi:hypothetical protein MGH68_19310 [Erysipelothrix sp. D19-032]